MTASSTSAAGVQFKTVVVNVSCATGKLATGGGGTIAGAAAAQDVEINQSIPNGNPPTGWHLQVEQGGTGTTSWSATAYVICTT